MPIADVYRNPTRWRAVVHTQDVRHGTAGCLLSIILLAPLFVRQFGMVAIATAVLTYSLVIVPALTNYFSPIKILMKLIRGTREFLVKTRSPVTLSGLRLSAAQFSSLIISVFEEFKQISVLFFNIISLPLYCLVHCFVLSIHGFYLVLEGFRKTTNQIVFFMLCEKLLCPEARLSSLYFLLFYTVLAYLYKSLLTRQWSQSFYESNIHDFLKLTTWFIAVRLAKGVAMAFVLIIFTMKFNHVEPNLFFLCVTFVYFVLTQRKWTGNEVVVSWFRNLQIDSLEEEEDYWIPFFLKILPISMSSILMGLVMFQQQILCSIAAYTNVLVPVLLLKKEFEERNVTQTVSILSFKKATKEDLEKNQICPICLDTMRVARVTPCKHVYHAVCLRKCLSLSCLCPMCKRSLATSTL